MKFLIEPFLQYKGEANPHKVLNFTIQGQPKRQESNQEKHTDTVLDARSSITHKYCQVPTHTMEGKTAKRSLLWDDYSAFTTLKTVLYMLYDSKCDM